MVWIIFATSYWSSMSCVTPAGSDIKCMSLQPTLYPTMPQNMQSLGSQKAMQGTLKLPRWQHQAAS